MEHWRKDYRGRRGQAKIRQKKDGVLCAISEDLARHAEQRDGRQVRSQQRNRNREGLHAPVSK